MPYTLSMTRTIRKVGYKAKSKVYRGRRYPAGIVPGLVVKILWFVIYWRFRAVFYGTFFSETSSMDAKLLDRALDEIRGVFDQVIHG